MKWKNQYMELVHTLPGYIVSIEDEHELTRAREQLAEKSEPFATQFVEIGSGSGHHLIQRALQDPDSLYIGFELRYKRSYRTAEKAQAEQLNNVLVVRGTADYLPKLFGPKEIAGVFVNFPDPWAKRRWRKHRILNKDYLQKMAALLSDDGFLAYKTDHKEYFKTTVALLTSMKEFTLTAQTDDLYQSDYLPENVTTEFEQLFLSKNLPVFYLKCHKHLLD